jgi:16S rRNA C967 or C1407 C5-methylase (RsmB/RsmF family)
METARYTLSQAHVTHDQHIDVIDTQPEDPSERIVAVCKTREEAEIEANRLNNDFVLKARKMQQKGLVWTRAHRVWAWLRPYN